jgi:hypothetical protein
MLERATSVEAYESWSKAARAAQPRWNAGIVRHGGRWLLVTLARAVHDDRAAIDAMRALPYDRWAAFYAKLPRPTATFTRDGLEVDGARVVARGLRFWRWYYGAPSRGSDADVLAKHVATEGVWSFEATGARCARTRAEHAYAARVKRVTLAAARKYAACLERRKAHYDAARVREAFANLTVYIIPRESQTSLQGALYPVHSTENKLPTRETMHRNARALAVREGADLASLLAHEIAHALFPPVWQDENHPPAFRDANAELVPIVSDELHRARP